MGLRMLGRIKVMTRWVNDTVWLHDGGQERGQGRVREPPPDGKQAEDGEVRSGLRRVVSLRKN